MSDDTISSIKETSVVIDGERWTADQFFTTGSCSYLAMALAELVEGGRIIALYEQVGEDFEPIETPYLIHAAVVIGDSVIDIESCWSENGWIANWSALATAPDVVTYDGSHPFEYPSDEVREFARMIAPRLLAAWEEEIMSPPQPSSLPTLH